MESGEGFWETIRALAVVVSAIVAAVSLGYSAVGSARQREKDNADKRASQVAQWQRAVVFEIFHKEYPNGPLSFSDILNKYRSEATGVEVGMVMPENLSPQSLRSILIDLIADGAITQVGSETFLLYVNSEDRYAKDMLEAVESHFRNTSEEMKTRGDAMTERMFGLVTEGNLTMQTLNNQRNAERQVAAVVRSLVFDNPGRYTRAELILVCMERCEAERALVVSCVMEQLSRGEIRLGAEDKIEPARTILGSASGD